MNIQFIGKPSGDYESFCWDVDLDTYKKIKTEHWLKLGKNLEWINKTVLDEDSIESDESCFNDGLYRIYPDDIFEDKEFHQVSIEIK